MFKQLAVALLMGLFAITMLAGCRAASSTLLTFSYANATPGDFTDEKRLHVNEGAEELVIHTKLTINSGSAEIQLIDNATGKAVWLSTLTKNARQDIILPTVAAGSEYTIRFTATGTKKVNLTLSCNKKLVKVIDMPSK